MKAVNYHTIQYDAKQSVDLYAGLNGVSYRLSHQHYLALRIRTDQLYFPIQFIGDWITQALLHHVIRKGAFGAVDIRKKSVRL